jgi:hypothetical protein
MGFKGQRSNRDFQEWLKEELISWLNSKGELWRSINGSGGNFEAKSMNLQVYQLDIQIQHFDEQHKGIFLD